MNQGLHRELFKYPKLPISRGGTGATSVSEAETNLSFIPKSQRDAADGVATLDENAKVRSSDLYGFRAAAAGGKVWYPVACGAGSTQILTEDRAYFVFVGQMAEDVTPGYVRCIVAVAGAGAQTAEMGLFSTTGPPDSASLSFTKIEATGSLDALTGTGVKKNSSAFTTLVPAGTYLWAGMRTAMAGAEPTIVATGPDWGTGCLQFTSTAGALTGSGPWTGALFTAQVTPAPALIVSVN